MDKIIGYVNTMILYPILFPVFKILKLDITISPDLFIIVIDLYLALLTMLIMYLFGFNIGNRSYTELLIWVLSIGFVYFITSKIVFNDSKEMDELLKKYPVLWYLAKARINLSVIIGISLIVGVIYFAFIK